MEVGGGGRTVTYQILVVVPFAIQVVMQITSTKIIPKCSIVVIKSLNLPKTKSDVVLRKQSSTHLATSLPPSA
jgi:hypothetical protein